jgi:large subunit ribosomal protein L2
MYLKKRKPITPGTRHQIVPDKSLLAKDLRVKSLLERVQKHSGRNSFGHISIRHKGGGLRRIYRSILLGSEKLRAIVLGISYDPNRTSYISKVFDLEKQKFNYILSNANLYPGSLIEYGPNVDLRLGNRKPISGIPTGSILSIVASKLNSKGIYARAAGTSCQLIQKGLETSKMRLPSGKVIEISSQAYATIGSIGNATHKLEVIGKAGRSRLKGIRPSVRGVAMNPVDHPHGGGQGKTKGGRPSVTPWARPTKGKPTKKK